MVVAVDPCGECGIKLGETRDLSPLNLRISFWLKTGIDEGDEGAIGSEFSNTSYDEFDIFRDHGIKRIPEISE
ncbi:MAG: D-lyxose isomerase [Bacilli bacterium]|nr:D-lyxose isomerase [Bacilli bacterium]